MNAVEKIKYFYDNVKLKNAAPIVEKAKKSLGVIISAAAVSAVSLIVGAAVLIPAIVKKQSAKSGKVSKAGRAV